MIFFTLSITYRAISETLSQCLDFLRHKDQNEGKYVLLKIPSLWFHIMSVFFYRIFVQHDTVCVCVLFTIYFSPSLPVPVPPTSEGIKPCTDAPPVPTNAVLKYQFGHNGSYGRYYECKEKSGWMFGMAGRLTQCLTGKWTPIHDMCDEGERFVAGVRWDSFVFVRREG